MRIDENKSMAIINFTCDYPNQYYVAEIARWFNLSDVTVRKLVDLLDLDVDKSGQGETSFRRKPPLNIKEYIIY